VLPIGVALCLSLLAGAGAASTVRSSGNACLTASGSTNCRWDVRVDAFSSKTIEGETMTANWVGTYTGVDLALQDTYLATRGDWKDVIKMQGGHGGRGRIAGRISYESAHGSERRTTPCQWSKSFNVPALFNVSSYVKLRKPIEGHRAFNFQAHEIPDVPGYGFGLYDNADYCTRGNTQVVGLGQLEPPPAIGALSYVEFSEGLSTSMVFEWWKPLPRLPYPLTIIRAGKSFAIRKSWAVPRNGQSGHLVITFTRRR